MITQPNKVRRHKHRQPHVPHTGDTKTLVPSDYCTLIQNSDLTNEKWAEILDVKPKLVARMRKYDYIPTAEMRKRIDEYIKKENEHD